MRQCSFMFNASQAEIFDAANRFNIEVFGVAPNF